MYKTDHESRLSPMAKTLRALAVPPQTPATVTRALGMKTIISDDNRRESFDDEGTHQANLLTSTLRYTSDGYTVNLIPSMLAGAVGLIGEN